MDLSREAATEAMSPTSKVLLLRQVPLLAGLETEQLLAVAAIADTVELSDGEVVFDEGQAGDRVYIVASGAARVLKGTKTIATLGEREAFGEMALLDGGSRSATVIAVGRLTCLGIRRDDFADLLDVSPAVAKSVMRVLTTRLRKAGRTA